MLKIGTKVRVIHTEFSWQDLYVGKEGHITGYITKGINPLYSTDISVDGLTAAFFERELEVIKDK